MASIHEDTIWPKGPPFGIPAKAASSYFWLSMAVENPTFHINKLRIDSHSRFNDRKLYSSLY
ncbi:hypothetical protein L484_024886 [Morus notabilis]|uniref:Uncharacterized protein n=1 Tax=Morus notabilis TaxID=981085 RepID=W9QWX8_9ROSA|nr:hypothetical protein L484_024886 [Morus notabilis]